MAVSTTPEKVQAVIDTDLDVTPFITTATAFYDTRVGSALPDEIGSEVLTYLAAHFVAVTDPREKTESVATGSWTLEGKASANETGLHSTQHGQMAVALDTSGRLRDVDKRKARFTVL